MADREAYDVEPEDCDAPADCVRAFRVLRGQVLDLLMHDVRSVRAQMSELFWQDAAFRIFNLARRFSERGRETSAVSGLLASYLDTAYVAREVTEVARLLERPGDDPAKGVVSLPTVIKLVREGRHLITRDVYVAHGGLPYDYEAAQVADREGLRARGGGAGWASPKPAMSAIAHRTFDRLSGTAPDRRSRDDKLKPGLLRWLEEHLTCAETTKFRRLRNKVFAHAADSASRGASWTRDGISLNDVDQVHRRLLEVAEVLSQLVSGYQIAPIVTASGDVLYGLDRPFLRDENLPDVRELLDEYARTREEWTERALDAAPCKPKPART